MAPFKEIKKVMGPFNKTSHKLSYMGTGQKSTGDTLARCDTLAQSDTLARRHFSTERNFSTEIIMQYFLLLK